MKISMHRICLPLLCLLSLAACSGTAPSISTGSLFGSASANAAPQAAANPGAAATPAAATEPALRPVTPTDRVFQVAAVTARAKKCGYNFDPDRLKATYFAAEAKLGTPPTEIANLEKVYTVAYNGVSKVANTEADYCSEKKTGEIKTDLARLLAGDFNPPPKKVVAQQDSIFDTLFSGDAGENGPAYGSQEWWDKQAEKAGK